MYGCVYIERNAGVLPGKNSLSLTSIRGFTISCNHLEKLGSFEVTKPSGVNCILTFFPSILGLAFAAAETTFFKDVSIASVSYTHLTLPTNREV